jgi:hypothetical protein
MRVSRVGTTVVTVHDQKAPSDPEWDEMIQHFIADPGAHLIVATNGAAPSSAQRNRLRAAYARRAAPRIGLLTDNGFVLGVLRVLNLFFQDQFKPFPTHQQTAAFVYAGVPEADRAQVSAELARLMAELKRPAALTG